MNTASIKLPLSRHARTGNMCWYVDRQTLTPIMTPEYILDIQQIRAADAKALIPECTVATDNSTNKKDGSERGHSSPETRNLGTTLEQEGTRHNMMRNIAVFKRTHGTSREDCESALEEWIQRRTLCIINPRRARSGEISTNSSPGFIQSGLSFKNLRAVTQRFCAHPC